MGNSKKNIPVIAENIRTLRAKKGISQDRLSKLADISLHTIAKIEAGDTPNPTIDTVQKIAIALEVSVDILLNHNKK